MALVKCKECGEKVSTRAANCPHCGAPVRKEMSKAGGCLLVFVICAVGLIIYSASSGDADRRDAKSSARTEARTIPRGEFDKLIAEPSAAAFQNRKENATYTLVDERISDSPIRTQITQHIFVTGIPSNEGLEAEIRQRYRAALGRSGFEFSITQRPTSLSTCTARKSRHVQAVFAGSA